MSDVSEDDLKTFDGWMRFQNVDPAALTPEQLDTWRELFEQSRAIADATPKLGLMKLRPMQPGERRYAVAISNATELSLTLWVRRSTKSEFFVMVPRGDRAWDPHVSYHLDGAVHVKSYSMKSEWKQEQPLTGPFHGVVNLGAHAGHGSGAVCDPSAFTGVVAVPPGVLGSRDGAVHVHLCEPGAMPSADDWPFRKVYTQRRFDDAVPHVVITVVVE